jgi:hypothetical protein
MKAPQPSNEILLKCCYGITSKANENEIQGHCLFLDYDKKDRACVIEHLNYIQYEYHLSDIFVIKSTNGFNAVVLDVLPLAECLRIMIDVSSPIDRDFATYGFNRGYYTLRFGSDKELFMIIPSAKRSYERSLAHKKFLEFFFGIQIKDDGSFNDFTKLGIIQFPSDKDGYHYTGRVIPDYFDLYRKYGGTLND